MISITVGEQVVREGKVETQARAAREAEEGSPAVEARAANSSLILLAVGLAELTGNREKMVMMGKRVLQELGATMDEMVNKTR
jgi:hypothetical protein